MNCLSLEIFDAVLGMGGSSASGLRERNHFRRHPMSTTIYNGTRGEGWPEEDF